MRNLQYKINLSQSLRHIVIFASTLLNTYIGLSGTMTCAALPKYNDDECASNSTLSGSVRQSISPSNITTAAPLSAFTTTAATASLPPTDYDNTICQSPQVERFVSDVTLNLGHVQFIELYALLVLLSCASFLRFYHFMRLGTLVTITTVFTIMMTFTYRRLFYEWEARLVPETISSLSCLLVAFWINGI